MPGGSLGDRFRAAREARGSPSRTVSDQVRIRSVYLRRHRGGELEGDRRAPFTSAAFCARTPAFWDSTLKRSSPHSTTRSQPQAHAAGETAAQRPARAERSSQPGSLLHLDRRHRRRAARGIRRLQRPHDASGSRRSRPPSASPAPLESPEPNAVPGRGRRRQALPRLRLRRRLARRAPALRRLPWCCRPRRGSGSPLTAMLALRVRFRPAPARRSMERARWCASATPAASRFSSTARTSANSARSGDVAERAFTLIGVRLATDASFDIVSRIDRQELDNALNQARKEIENRFDFKHSKTSIEADEKKITTRLRRRIEDA